MTPYTFNLMNYLTIWLCVWEKKILSFWGWKGTRKWIVWKKCIDELSNYLGGCIGKRFFSFFLKVRGVKGQNVFLKCISEVSNYFSGCIEKKNPSFWGWKGCKNMKYIKKKCVSESLNYLSGCCEPLFITINLQGFIINYFPNY